MLFAVQDQQIVGSLASKVIAYYEYMWQRTKGLSPQNLFDGMPQNLWGDVTLSLYGNILKKVIYHQ